MPPLSPSEAAEARNRRYARDTLRLRLLESGRWCVYDTSFEPIGAATTLEEIALLAQPLAELARIARENLEAELALNRKRAADKREAADLDLSDLELDL